VVKPPPRQGGSGRRRMLVHDGHRSKHVPTASGSLSPSAARAARQQAPAQPNGPPARNPRQSQAAAHQALTRARQSRDPWPILLATASFVALISIALVAWLLLTRVSGSIGSSKTTLSRLTSAEATRDAQQAAIRSLSTESARMRQDLATASAYATRAATTPSPDSTSLDRAPLALVLNVPIYKQQHSLGCESTAAAMAANYHHVDVSEQDILDALPRNENPHLGFRGDIDGPYGGIEDYGVYAGPIRQVLTRLGLDAQHLEGGLDEIKAALRHGRPVIVWVTYGLQAQTPQQVVMPDDQTVTLVPYEHTVLIVGYNRDGLWVNDPFTGTQDFYSEGDFLRSFAYLGNMALVVGSPANP
jgi:uncharacterized protein YvpB